MRNGLFQMARSGLMVWLTAAAAHAELKVATLHPLLTDLARQVGGDRLTVLAIARPGTDMHHFSPSTRDM